MRLVCPVFRLAGVGCGLAARRLGDVLEPGLLFVSLSFDSPLVRFLRFFLPSGTRLRELKLLRYPTPRINEPAISLAARGVLAAYDNSFMTSCVLSSASTVANPTISAMSVL